MHQERLYSGGLRAASVVLLTPSGGGEILLTPSGGGEKIVHSGQWKRQRHVDSRDFHERGERESCTAACVTLQQSISLEIRVSCNSSRGATRSLRILAGLPPIRSRQVISMIFCQANYSQAFKPRTIQRTYVIPLHNRSSFSFEMPV